MKKVLLIIVLIATVSLVKAQKTYLWVNGGAAISTQIQSQKGDGTRGSVVGPYAGIFVRAQYPTHFGYEAGLYYASKGTKFPDNNLTVQLNYVGAYGDFFMNFPLEHNNNIFVGPGIYLAQAINGKNKYDSTTGNIKFGDVWKSIDGGVEVKSGITFKNLISIAAQYNISVIRNYTSAVPTQRENYNKGRNSSFIFTLGLKLASLSKK